MAPEWAPATGLERALLEALQRQDHEHCLRLLRGVGLQVPVQVDAAGRTTGWVTSVVGDRTYLLCYTSPESLAAATGVRDAPAITATLTDLARRWPDSAWWLAVNAGLPVELSLPPQRLAELLDSADTESGGAPVGDLSSAGYAEAAAAQADPRVATRVFRPANEVESAMFAATRDGDTDAYLKALLVAEVLLPRSPGELAGPGEPDYTWPEVEFEGQRCVPLFTSEERLVECLGDVAFVRAEALAVVRHWPGPALGLTVNPGTPAGGSLPGPEVVALADWVSEIGLFDILDRADQPPQAERPDSAERSGGGEPRVLQKLLPPEHMAFYRGRGYHMVSGYVHRLDDVGRGSPPADLRRALGLDGGLDGGSVGEADQVAHVVRWQAYGDGRYGDDRPGAGPQFRVSGVPLPHGAVLCRIDPDGGEVVVASFDADTGRWLDQEES